MTDMAASRMRGWSFEDAGPALRQRAIPEGQLRIPAATQSGFDVTLFAEQGRFRASFGGLVQDFDRLEDAMPWVSRALSASHRLRIDFVGSRPVQWTLEELAPDGSAYPVLASGHPGLTDLLRCFGERHTIYQQNG